MAKLVQLAAILAVLFALSVTSMSLLESLEWKIIFFPTAPIESTPADFGAKYEDVYFPTDDGEQLNGWFVPGPATESGNPKPTMLWFHGNGGNLSHRTDGVVWLAHRLNVNVFIFDYRGYGRSTGRPTEAGVYQDSRAALAYLITRDDVSRERILFLGRSLGTAIAVELAAALPEDAGAAGLILVSPLASTKDMARVHNRFNPLRFLVPDRFNSLSRISHIRSPLLIIHSDRDEMIPLGQARRLYDAAAEPKSFYLWSGAGHNDIIGPGQEGLWNSIENFLNSLPELAG